MSGHGSYLPGSSVQLVEFDEDCVLTLPRLSKLFKLDYGYVVTPVSSSKHPETCSYLVFDVVESEQYRKRCFSNSTTWFFGAELVTVLEGILWSEDLVLMWFIVVSILQLARTVQLDLFRLLAPLSSHRYFGDRRKTTESSWCIFSLFDCWTFAHDQAFFK